MDEERHKRKELRKTLKKKVLDRLMSAEPGTTIHTIVNQNAMFCRMRHMRDIPMDHRDELDLIKQEEVLYSLLKDRFNALGLDLDAISPQPRAVKQLNLIEKLRGGPQRQWSYAANLVEGLSPSGMAMLNIHNPSPTLN